ncbi:MAG: L-2-hydroxyglutarate oxidase [Flavobacteriaceae bacterium]|nr:L-2-hydroxyglutarate oxidase [Flavobacteriaceae bacterium]
MKNLTFDFIVVGAGIVGAATAYKLQLKFPKKSIAILEKENTIAFHQTGRNSGVIHSGIYYAPGSLKALNCRKGRSELIEFAKENNIKHDVCGKIIVATNADEASVLDNIFQNGIKNQTEGITFLSAKEIKEKEPFIDGVKAIWVPTAGIINYVDVANKFIDLVIQKNTKSKLFTNCEVKDIINKGKHILVQTNMDDLISEKVIVCAGLQSDRIAKNNKLQLDMQIVGFRGDYYEFLNHAKHKINNLVYPVPDPKYPFLGVHFTPMINGDIECGPNAVFTFKREGYHKTSFSLKDTLQAFTFIGTWKLFAKNWKKGLDEYQRAFSKKLFVKELKKLMPSITENDVQASRSGIRAQAVDQNGEMVDDFKIIKDENMIHVINAPSPAATACLAIADEIIAKTFSEKITRNDVKSEQGDCCYYKEV